MDIVKKLGVERLVAAGAALITGAAVYMMPQNVLQEAAIASGLSAAFPPLEPPLGAKARIGLALFAAGIAFGLIVTLVGLIGRVGKAGAKPRKAVVAAKDEGPALPKLRRRDRHPDAPARAPLLIEQEVGVPDEEEPQRRIRSGWGDDILPPEPAFAPDPVILPEPVAEAEPPAEPEWQPEREAVERTEEPEPFDDEEPQAAPERVAAHPAWLDVSAPQPPLAQLPLVELVERLERALEARTATRAAPVIRAPEPAVAKAETDGTDARLRSALESLKRFAPQRG